MGEAQRESAVRGGYEFDAEQDRVIGAVAKAFKFVGIFLLVYGVIQLLGALDDAQAHHWLTAAHGVFDGVLFLVISAMMRRGAAALRDVVTTQGNDIPNLITGLAEVGRAMRTFGWAVLGLMAAQLVYLLAYFAARHLGVHLPTS